MFPLLGLPVGVSFTLVSGTSRLMSGPSVHGAVEAVDLECGDE
ncbi:MAG: hypothetical protein U1F08_09645 [Steroidobacteraceae bacterium]